ncbi:hypothetical protein SAMN05421812_104331 [Asanoa hainanensis]|uniref:Uncharacterized protein n=1 Tax=Asanoa hainanensis TaxID=560556 RepID=A0A239LHG4_9ACTN|nr:hypothetical protein [Asanoa hainanensis]SNT29805.1 hypothetical protein SAMN05421812_104331 [Asanoa hainanensis]
MKFLIQASGDAPVIVTFEPSGAEYSIGAGDHMVVEWPDADGPLMGTIQHSPTGLTVGEPSGRMARIWNSSGAELSILGQ